MKPISKRAITDYAAVILVWAAISIAAFALSGCAKFITTQEDTSYDATTGNKTRTITTQASARTFFDANSQLAKFKATQTDKTQSATVGTLNQESSGSNAVQVLRIVVEGAAAGAAKALAP